MAMQDYTPVINVLETLKCTICRPKLNLTFTGEFLSLDCSPLYSTRFASRKLFIKQHHRIHDVLKTLHQNILHQLRFTDQQTGFIERENSHIKFVTVFVLDSLQLFSYSCLQQHTVLKIAYNTVLVLRKGYRVSARSWNFEWNENTSQLRWQR